MASIFFWRHIPSIISTELILYSIHTYILLHTHRITGYLKLEEISGEDLVQPTSQSWVSSDVRSTCSGLYPVSLETSEDGDYSISLSNCSLLDCPYGENIFPQSTLYLSFQFIPSISHPPTNTGSLLTDSPKAISPPRGTSPCPSASHKANAPWPCWWPLLNSLQLINIISVLWGLKPGAIFYMRPTWGLMSAEQTRIIPSLNLPAVGCCCPSLLPRHTAGSYLGCCLLGLPHPFQQNCPQSVSSQPVLLHGVIPFQMQEFAVAHAEFHKAPVSHFLQPTGVTQQQPCPQAYLLVPPIWLHQQTWPECIALLPSPGHWLRC